MTGRSLIVHKSAIAPLTPSGRPNLPAVPQVLIIEKEVPVERIVERYVDRVVEVPYRPESARAERGDFLVWLVATLSPFIMIMIAVYFGFKLAGA